MELEGCRHVVSTSIPASATMRSTMVAKIAMAVRPKAAELLTGKEVATGAEVSGDTLFPGGWGDG